MFVSDVARFCGDDVRAVRVRANQKVEEVK